MRLIDADALVKDLSSDGDTGAALLLNIFVEVVKSRPTIDAVPVVWCKDCEWWNDAGCAIEINHESDKPKENDFCSFGERWGEHGKK